MAAVEAAALDGLAEELLGQGEERRDEEKDGGGPESVDINSTQGVLTSSRLGMLCDEETKYIALKYGHWGFQKCI